MKYSSLVRAEPALLRPEDAAQFLGGESVLRRVVEAGWLRPAHQQHRMTLYTLEALKVVAARIVLEGLPAEAQG